MISNIRNRHGRLTWARVGEHFRFSFLMALPALAGAFIFLAPEMAFSYLYLAGLLVTIVVGYAALALMQRLVLGKYFHWFGLYTAVLAVTIFLI